MDVSGIEPEFQNPGSFLTVIITGFWGRSSAIPWDAVVLQSMDCGSPLIGLDEILAVQFVTVGQKSAIADNHALRNCRKQQKNFKVRLYQTVVYSEPNSTAIAGNNCLSKGPKSRALPRLAHYFGTVWSRIDMFWRTFLQIQSHFSVEILKPLTTRSSRMYLGSISNFIVKIL